MRYLTHVFVALVCFAVNAQQLDYGVYHAKRTILDEFGDRVTIRPGKILKFGRNDDLSTTRETVYVTGGTEILPTGNTIDSISSSSAADTQIITVEGNIISGSTISNEEFTDTLTGQTVETLNTSLYRVSRIINEGSSDFQGTIYVYSGGAVVAGVPQVQDSIHLTLVIGDNQSHKTAVTIPSGQYYIITQLVLSVNISGNQSRRVDFDLEVREFGKTFRRIFPASVTNDLGVAPIPIKPHIIIKPNSDVRITAISSGTGTQVRAVMNGYLADIR